MRDYESINKSNPNHYFVGWTGIPTDNYQLKAADTLISKLKFQLGQEKAYNEELQDRLDNSEASKSLREEVEKLKATLKEKDSEILACKAKISNQKTELHRLNDKFYDEANTLLNTDDIYRKTIEKIDSVIYYAKGLEKKNQDLLQEIIKLRNGN